MRSSMKCGVKFCGGCNPRYQRGDAYRQIRDELEDIEFDYAQEEVPYDQLLVIGGCPACCASHKQYTTENEVIKMWDESHIESVKEQLLKRKQDKGE